MVLGLLLFVGTSDITCFRTHEALLYLAIVIDLTASHWLVDKTPDGWRADAQRMPDGGVATAAPGGCKPAFRSG